MEEQTKTDLRQWLQPKHVFTVLAILVVTAVVIVSILRERIVDRDDNRVTVSGQGKVSYQPDTATVTLGVQVDKAPTGEAALERLNGKINGIIMSIEALGIKKEDIRTQAYNLYAQYDYKDNVSVVAGYNANQKLSIKVSDIRKNPESVSRVIAAASAAGTNQVEGIEFAVSDINDLKQQARILAIKDAKSKSAALASAAGVKLRKVTGWFESSVQGPENPIPMGMGGRDMAVSKEAPQVPAGTQDIIIEVSLLYEVE